MKSIDRHQDGINTDLFVQVPVALLDSGIEAGALVTYMAIRRVAWHVGSYYQDGAENLAAATGLSRRTITRHLQALEDVCAINVDRRGARNTNYITVLPYDGIVSLPDPVCGETSVADHVHHDDRTPMSHHIEVIGHETLCDETPVSPTIGHPCLIRIEEDPPKKITEEDSLSYVHTESETSEGPDRFAVVLDEEPGGSPDGASPSARSTSGALWWCGLDGDEWWTHPDFTEGLDEWSAVVQELTVRAQYRPHTVLSLIRGAWSENQDVQAVVQELRRALAAE